APGEGRSLEPAAGGVLPLRFGRQLLAGPGGVRLRILERDLHDGRVVAAVDRRALAARVLPLRARYVLPPVAMVVEVDRAGGLAEDERARDEQVGVAVREVGRVEGTLRKGDVPGLAHEAAKLGRGHRVPVD